MAWASTSRIRLAVRKAVLSFDQQRSIGDKSGEYGGQYRNWAPACSIASRTPAAFSLWPPSVPDGLPDIAGWPAPSSTLAPAPEPW